MSRVLEVIRCPADGRTMARLEADPDGTVWINIVGGKRGDLGSAADWEQAKGRPLVDAPTEEEFHRLRAQVYVPTSVDPAIVDPRRMRLTGLEDVWLNPTFLDLADAPMRVVCPRCHRTHGVRLGVSAGGGWNVVLA